MTTKQIRIQRKFCLGRGGNCSADLVSKAISCNEKVVLKIWHPPEIHWWALHENHRSHFTKGYKEFGFSIQFLNLRPNVAIFLISSTWNIFGISHNNHAQQLFRYFSSSSLHRPQGPSHKFLPPVNLVGVASNPNSYWYEFILDDFSYISIGLSCWGLPMRHWVALLDSHFFTLWVFIRHSAFN